MGCGASSFLAVVTMPRVRRRLFSRRRRDLSALIPVRQAARIGFVGAACSRRYGFAHGLFVFMRPRAPHQIYDRTVAALAFLPVRARRATKSLTVLIVQTPAKCISCIGTSPNGRDRTRPAGPTSSGADNDQALRADRPMMAVMPPRLCPRMTRPHALRGHRNRGIALHKDAAGFGLSAPAAAAQSRATDIAASQKDNRPLPD